MTTVQPLHARESPAKRPLRLADPMTDGADALPDGALPRAQPGLKRLGGRTLILIGILGLLFGFFQVTVADVFERRDQRSLRGAFQDLIKSGAPLGATADGKPGIIAPGKPIGMLEIPSLGVRKIVIEGTEPDHLKQGPGHLRSSVIPGQYGHAIIAGRRTTYGAPFKGLDLLRSGDEIIATTPYGRFTYRVRETKHLEPRKALTLQQSTSGLLTLMTSDPPYTPNGALLVDAELVGEPSTFEDPPRIKAQAGAIDFTGDIGAIIGVALAGLLLFGALTGAQLLYQRWHRWPTYLTTTPVILALLVVWLEGLLSILPSTL